MEIVTRAGLFVVWVLVRLCCAVTEHDFFNGGERCRDCGAPRPPDWKP